MSEDAKLTRRDFIKLAGGAAGATALACSGLTILATQQQEVEFIESDSGKEKNVEDRVLIAYASKCGSTGEVAEAIGQVLCANGTATDVRLVKNVADLSPYRAVVLGSAIRMGRWLPEAVKFAETHRDALGRVPVAYFTVCATLREDTEENRRTVAAYMDPLRKIVQPVGEGMFAGKMDYSKLSFLNRMIIKVVGVPEGDYRDWDAIRAWATGLPPAMLGA